MGLTSPLRRFETKRPALFSAVGGRVGCEQSYSHRLVLEMEIYFGFYGEGRRHCSRLFPEAGKNYAPGEFNHWASARSFSIGGAVKETL